MAEKAYKHFETIYGNTAEPVIVVDSSLDIVFMTASVQLIFGIEASAANIGCVINHKYFRTLHTAISEHRYETLTFKAFTGQFMRCEIIPHKYGSDSFVAVIFTHTDEKLVENLQKHELVTAIKTAGKSIADSSVDIVSALRVLGKKAESYELSEMALRNMLSIRRNMNVLNMLAAVSVKSKHKHVIELNSHISYLTELAAKKLKKNTVEFTLDLCSDILLAEIKPDIFEILFFNIISNSLAASLAPAKICIQTSSQNQRSLVLISDRGRGFPNIDRMFKDSPSGIAENTGLGVPIIRRIVTEHGGSIFAGENKTGGVSLGFSLPRAENRGTIFKSPAELGAERSDFFSTVNMELAKFLAAEILNIKGDTL